MKNTDSYLLLTSLRVYLLKAGCFGIVPAINGKTTNWLTKSKCTLDSSMKFSDFISNSCTMYIFLILVLMLVCESLLSNMVCWSIFNIFFLILTLVKQSSIHCANSFANFCLWYWDWVASLFVLDSEDSFAHFFFSLNKFFTFICISLFLIFTSTQSRVFLFLLEFS